MSRADFEEREKFKRFVSAAISKPKIEEEEEFNKFLNDLSCCTLMNRKGLEPIFCDFYNWSQQAKEPETVEIHVVPSVGMMPPKATIVTKHGFAAAKAKPESAAVIRVKLKTVPPEFEPSAIGYYHPRSKPKYGILNKEVIRAEAEKASRSYLTPEMNSLLDAINKSRSLLELEDNWDGEGSIGYDESTWLRARNFLMKNAVRLHQSQKKSFDPPEISPGPNGSIDLHWKTDARELLINVPADPQNTIGYYGDDRAEDTENAIRGKNIESSKNTEWIFLWLTQ